MNKAEKLYNFIADDIIKNSDLNWIWRQSVSNTFELYVDFPFPTNKDYPGYVVKDLTFSHIHQQSFENYILSNYGLEVGMDVFYVWTYLLKKLKEGEQKERFLSESTDKQQKFIDAVFKDFYYSQVVFMYEETNGEWVAFFRFIDRGGENLEEMYNWHETTLSPSDVYWDAMFSQYMKDKYGLYDIDIQNQIYTIMVNTMIDKLEELNGIDEFGNPLN
jgi:hypothetical protein